LDFVLGFVSLGVLAVQLLFFSVISVAKKIQSSEFQVSVSVIGVHRRPSAARTTFTL
jgi:hypothetical protein